MDSAKVLYEKSNRIYEGMGDSGGVTVTSSDLATLMFAKKDFKAVRRYLARAFGASERTSGLRDDDIAGLYSVKSALALHEQENAEAISDSRDRVCAGSASFGRQGASCKPEKRSQQRAGQLGVAAMPWMYHRCQRFQVTGYRVAIRAIGKDANEFANSQHRTLGSSACR
jgi:hypothetical protein